MQNTMKSPLMDNTDDNISDTRTVEEKRERFKRNSSHQRSSVETQTSTNYSILSPLNSSHPQSAILCRICYNGDIKESLLQPCDCSGTMGLIHKTCLEKWLSQSNKNQCEICSYNYDVVRQKRPFFSWLVRPITTKDTKNLLNDVLCFLILTPLAFISTWYSICFAFEFTENDNQLETSGLVILTTFLVIIYFLWLTFSIRYHYKVFLDWQENNQIVTLRLNKDNMVLASDLSNFKQRQFSQTELSIETESIVDNKNLSLVENPNYELDRKSAHRKPIYKKNNSNTNNAEYRIESCVIEV